VFYTGIKFGPPHTGRTYIEGDAEEVVLENCRTQGGGKGRKM